MQIQTNIQLQKEVKSILDSYLLTKISAEQVELYFCSYLEKQLNVDNLTIEQIDMLLPTKTRIEYYEQYRHFLGLWEWGVMNPETLNNNLISAKKAIKFELKRIFTELWYTESELNDKVPMRLEFVKSLISKGYITVKEYTMFG